MECLKENCPFYKNNLRNSADGMPIIVPGQMLPKKDPSKDCACQYEPVDIEGAECYIQWLKDNGSFVKRDEPICEAQVDKKIIEFTAETDGYLSHRIENGDYFRAGSVIGTIKSKKY